MTTYGLTDQGFIPKTQDVLRDDIDGNIRQIMPSAPLGDTAWLGHFSGLFSLLYAELWQLGQAAFSARDPDAATKTRLAAVAAMTGTQKLPARPSIAIESCCGIPGTPIPSGSAVTTGGLPVTIGNAIQGPPGRRFHSTADAVIATVQVWVTLTGYLKDDQVTHASRVYRCITAGTTGATGPSTTSDDITDGTVHWQYVGEGVGEIDVQFASDDDGPIVAVAKDLSIIATEVTGWQSARNLADAVLGALEETDGDLRLRREQELAKAGTGPKDAIRADLLDVGKGTISPVTACNVYMNNEDTPDADGVPPHSVECVVVGGLDQAIYDQLLKSVVGGIRTHGTSVGSTVDSEGNTQVEKFTRPAAVAIYGRFALEYDATKYPSDGDVEVKTAIVAAGVADSVGFDAMPNRLAKGSYDVPGVDVVTDALIYTDVIGTPTAWLPTTGYVATVGSRSVVTNDGGRSYICITAGTSAGSGGPSGTGTDIVDGTVHWYYLGNKIAISNRQEASYDVGRITIVSSAVAP